MSQHPISDSQALRNISESADFIQMIEDLTNPANIDKITPAALSGMRLTLRNVRESLVDSYEQLSKGFVERSKSSASRPSNAASSQSNGAALKSSSSAGAPTPKVEFSRGDLKAALERYVE